MPLLRLIFHIDSDDLGDISAVIRIRAEELFGDTVICEKTAFLKVIAVKLAADQYKLCLLKSHAAVYLGRSETCLLCLIAVPARMGTAEGEGTSVFLALERSCEALTFLDEVIGIAVRSDVAGKDVLVPENSQLTP